MSINISIVSSTWFLLNDEQMLMLHFRSLPTMLWKRLFSSWSLREFGRSAWVPERRWTVFRNDLFNRGLFDPLFIVFADAYPVLDTACSLVVRLWALVLACRRIHSDSLRYPMRSPRTESPVSRQNNLANTFAIGPVRRSPWSRSPRFELAEFLCKSHSLAESPGRDGPR